MGLLSKTIAGIFNGISQQAQTLRQSNQAAEQINFLSEVSGGIRRRPPTRHCFSLPNSPANENTKIVPFNDTEGNEYFILYHTDSTTPLEVYHKDGTACAVTHGGTAKNYLLNATEPRRHIKTVCIGDYNLVVDTTRLVEMDAASSEVAVTYALYYCKQAMRYVTFNLGGASYTTPKTTETDSICSSSKVCEQLVAGLGSVAGVTFEHLDSGKSSVIRITAPQAYIDSLTSSDSYGNTLSFLLKGKAKKIEDLPNCAKDGDIMEITGKKEDSFSNYWLKWIEADNLWRECTSPTLANKFNPSTMPHQLVRTEKYAFTFSEGTTDETLEDAKTVWSSRKVGDADSAPEPSFVGQKIKDVFFFKNRFGAVANQNVVLSRPNDFFNFFPETATDTLDTDPLDMTTGSADVTSLIHAIPYEENLLLFADEGQQFIISSGGEVFTAATAAPNLTTSFPCDELCKPIMLGGDVFFPSTAGDFSRVREYFVTSDSQVNDAADITAHCPKYVASGIHAMAISNNSDILYCASKNDPSKLFVYRYYRVGNERPQSAWFTFEFPFEIIGINTFKDDKAYLIVKKNGQVSCEFFDVTENTSWFLDRQLENPSKALIDGKTEITIPYDDTVEPFIVVTEDSEGHIAVYPALQGATVVAGESCKLQINADLTGANIVKVVVGKTFNSEYHFSEWHIKDQKDSGILQGRLQLRTLTLDFQDTGDFKLKVKPEHRSERTWSYTGKSLGAVQIGARHVSSGQRRFHLGGNSKGTLIRIVSDSILPCNISSASFEGYFNARNQIT